MATVPLVAHAEEVLWALIAGGVRAEFRAHSSPTANSLHESAPLINAAPLRIIFAPRDVVRQRADDYATHVGFTAWQLSSLRRRVQDFVPRALFVAALAQHVRLPRPRFAVSLERSAVVSARLSDSLTIVFVAESDAVRVLECQNAQVRRTQLIRTGAPVTAMRAHSTAAHIVLAFGCGADVLALRLTLRSNTARQRTVKVRVLAHVRLGARVTDVALTEQHVTAVTSAHAVYTVVLAEHTRLQSPPQLIRSLETALDDRARGPCLSFPQIAAVSNMMFLQLLLDRVRLLDATGSKTSARVLVSSALTFLADEPLLALAAHPSEPFLFIVATPHSALLFDSRFPRLPVAQWKLRLPSLVDLSIVHPGSDGRSLVIASHASGVAVATFAVHADARVTHCAPMHVVLRLDANTLRGVTVLRGLHAASLTLIVLLRSGELLLQSVCAGQHGEPDPCVSLPSVSAPVAVTLSSSSDAYLHNPRVQNLRRAVRLRAATQVSPLPSPFAPVQDGESTRCSLRERAWLGTVLATPRTTAEIGAAAARANIPARSEDAWRTILRSMRGAHQHEYRPGVMVWCQCAHSVAHSENAISSANANANALRLRWQNDRKSLCSYTPATELTSRNIAAQTSSQSQLHSLSRSQSQSPSQSQLRSQGTPLPREGVTSSASTSMHHFPPVIQKAPSLPRSATPRPTTTTSLSPNATATPVVMGPPPPRQVIQRSVSSMTPRASPTPAAPAHVRVI